VWLKSKISCEEYYFWSTDRRIQCGRFILGYCFYEVDD
jgi:hypothetical protein